MGPTKLCGTCLAGGLTAFGEIYQSSQRNVLQNQGSFKKLQNVLSESEHHALQQFPSLDLHTSGTSPPHVMNQQSGSVDNVHSKQSCSKAVHNSGNRVMTGQSRTHDSPSPRKSHHDNHITPPPVGPIMTHAHISSPPIMGVTGEPPTQNSSTTQEPQNIGANVESRPSSLELRGKLVQLLDEEKFEEAAVVRDQIRAMGDRMKLIAVSSVGGPKGNLSPLNVQAASSPSHALTASPPTNGQEASHPVGRAPSYFASSAS